MADLLSKQKNKHGGARPGGGRPKGSKTKLKVSDFMSPEEKDLLVQKWKDLTILADNPDKQLFLELVHQLFGKATTKIAGDDNEDPLRIIEILRGEGNDKPTS